MRTTHCSEEDIQQYALDQQRCGTLVIQHMTHCETCQAKAVSYKLLFAEIQQEPKPVFDFDLATLVVAQLPQRASGFSWDRILVYGCVLTGVLFAGASAWLFRSFLANLLEGLAPLIIWLIATTIVTILIFQTMDMYKRYQKKMSALDLY
jgi:hypothetical protein